MKTRLLALLLIAGVVASAKSLECIVCMENSLDEFGECASQFRFDCASYAANFGKNEKIFCRTTRKREQNNTYTVAKECISERDHHRIFPKKDYPLEDECDLLEVGGSEIAYCLCRTPRCNQKPIAEQFMSFEEKHPELFGDLDEDIPSTSFNIEETPKRAEGETRSRPSPTLPLSKASAVKAPELTPIMPVNDPRSIINDNALRRAQPSFEIGKDVNEEGKGRSVLPSRGLDSALNIHKIGGAGNGKLPAKEIDELSPWSSARSLAEGPAPSPIAVAALRCMQCGEGGLATATDCLLQASVSCKHEQSFCFTRHIPITNDHNAVEKMCVSQEALISEYGQALDLSKRDIQCIYQAGGKIRICVCADEDNCNQRNIEDQFALSPSTPSRNSVKAASATLSQPVVPIDLGSELASSHAVAFNGIASSSLAISPDVQPIVPVGAESPSTTTTTRSPKVRTGLRCSVCSSGDLSDPTADCPTAVPMDCMALPGERSYCLTRQTQLSNGLFTMEKACMTGMEFSDDFPDEQPAPGCGTAFDGLVNYCLCAGEMCNRGSLLEQAGENIPAAAEKNHRPATTTTSRPLINQMKLHEEEPVQFAMEEDLEQPSVVPVPSRKVNEIPDLNTRLIEPVEEEAPEPSDEDKAKIQKMLREQQWKDETERLSEKSVDRLALMTSLLMCLTFLLAR